MQQSKRITTRFGLFILLFLAAACWTVNASAQSGYKTAAGLFLDLGNGGTYVGPSVKHFFDDNDAVQGMVLFGNHVTAIGVEYSYNKLIPNGGGFIWNIGAGPQVAFSSGTTAFLLRPQAGVEYKVPGAPIDLGFDWRPWWQLTQGSSFEAGRFGLRFDYVIK